jgi:hypothetical protein
MTSEDLRKAKAALHEVREKTAKLIQASRTLTPQERVRVSGILSGRARQVA